MKDSGVEIAHTNVIVSMVAFAINLTDSVNVQKDIEAIDANWNAQAIDMDWIARNRVVAKTMENAITSLANVHARLDSQALCVVMFAQLEHTAKHANQNVNVKMMVCAIRITELASAHQVWNSFYTQDEISKHDRCSVFRNQIFYGQNFQFIK